ncbi:MAG TPA: hypothetical protein DET40_18025 [Lentisphaeria bacterium]|nr:MAG: hypothetical protein A2X45_01990 [Lentisphaerae bacterium GWF2_50_93]HCE45441.1 hypothetical protein [Lentisphaeria bacterium]
MSKSSIKQFIPKFFESYDRKAKDLIWKNHSATFRKFWSKQVMAPGSSPLSDDECDVIIRILDSKGKGNTKQSEAVARAMVAQGAWRRLFNCFRSDKKLARLVDAILKEEEPDKKSALIDELYKMNEKNRNNLTGKSGNTIGVFLAAQDPFNNLSIISLNDRKSLIDFLESPLRLKWDSMSIGVRIVQSNIILKEEIQVLGIDGSARTQSRFWYFEPVKALWKKQHTINRPDKSVSVIVPESNDSDEEDAGEEEIRKSHQIQAVIAEIGTRMGFKIWLPKADRGRVLKKWKPAESDLLDSLPLNYDDTTIKTIEQIDVLWLRKRSIVRAFEVEHTTSVYSGLLRMADLIALQPNMSIKLHIVAPEAKREKVLQEIRRPVFSLLEGRALSEMCSYLSYENITEIREEKHLAHLSDHVLEDYEERADEAD